MEKVKRRFCSISKRITTGFLAILLSLLIAIGSAYKNPVRVQAAATAGGIAIGMLVAMAATALGIGVNASVNNESYQQSCEDLGNAVQEKIATAGKTLSMLVTVGADGVVTMSKEFLLDVSSELMRHYPKAQIAINSYTDVEKLLNIQSYSNSEVSACGSGWRYAFLTNSWPKLKSVRCLNSMKAPPVSKTDAYNRGLSNLVLDGVTGANMLFSAWEATSVLNDYEHYCSFNISGNSASLFNEIKFSAGILPHNSIISTMNPFVSWGGQVSVFAGYTIANIPVIFYLSGEPCAGAGGICAYPKTAQPLPYTGEDVFDPADKAFFAEGFSSMINSFNDVIGRIGAMQGVLVGIRAKVTDWTYPGIRTLTQTTILEKDITQTDDKTKDDKKNTEDDRNPSLPKNPSIPDVSIPNMVFRKFPFCLPIDFVRGVKMMQAPPTPPVFDVPVLVVPELHWDYHVKLDLEKFDNKKTLVGIVRWAVGILWSFGLVFITKRLIWK